MQKLVLFIGFGHKFFYFLTPLVNSCPVTVDEAERGIFHILNLVVLPLLALSFAAPSISQAFISHSRCMEVLNVARYLGVALIESYLEHVEIIASLIITILNSSNEFLGFPRSNIDLCNLYDWDNDVWLFSKLLELDLILVDEKTIIVQD